MGALPTEIDQLTRVGTEELWNGSLNKALEAFQTALKKAQQLNDFCILHVCALNLGATYIACQYPQAAIDILQRAIPSKNMKEKTASSNRDLYFNMGMAYEMTQNETQAVKYFELALEEFQATKDKNLEMEAMLGSKLGLLYLKIGNPLQAARGYGIAATAFAEDIKLNQQVQTLCKQAAALLKAQRIEDALRAADDSIILCQRVNKSDILAKLYSELGLIYAQCHEFGKAATCFELALPLFEGPQTDKRLQAVILQNLGAIYNSLADFQRSLGFHEAAASLYAELGNRSLQGQCFLNLAYAYSQLESVDNAADCYLHALQAARDAGDLRCQWQALEGLGVVTFNQGKTKLATRNFKEALATLAASRERNTAAQERIVAKLTKVLELQLAKGSQQNGRSKKAAMVVKKEQPAVRGVNIFVNDQPRPPTRQESRNRQELRNQRVARLKTLATNKLESEFETVALGVGDYDSDSDLSIKRRPASKRLKRLYSRQQSAPPAQHYADPGQDPHVRRRQRQPLLRTDTFDSEGEWRKRLAEMNGSTESSDVDSEDLLPRNRKQAKQALTNMQVKLGQVAHKFMHGEDSEDMTVDSADGEESEQKHRRRSRRGRRPKLEEYEEQLRQMAEEEEEDEDEDESEKGATETDRSCHSVSDQSTESQTGSTATSTSSEQSEAEEEEEEESKQPSKGKKRLVPPPLPERSPPSTLVTTYEKPVPSPGGALEKKDSQTSSKNYFRNYEADQEPSTSTFKMRAPDENDPTYMTIRTLKTLPEKDQENTDSDQSDSDRPPTPPPRRSQHKQQFEDLSRAEQEEILYEHHKNRNTSVQDDEPQPQLGKGKKGRATSSVCTVM